MAEENTQQTTEETPPPSTEPTLESVYEEFKVEPHKPAEPQQVQPQAQPQPQSPPEPVIPDPALDPEEYKKWARANVNETTQIKGALRQVAQHLQHYEQQRAAAVEEADIKKAVDVVNAKLKGDPDFAEIAIAQRARKDPKFMALWQGRRQNPAALEKGLNALATELSKKFEFRTDPQLTENQRAMKEATQTKAVGAPPQSVEDELAKLTGKDFDAAVRRIRRQDFV